MYLYMSFIWKRLRNNSNEMRAYRYFHPKTFPEKVCLPFELLVRKSLQYLLAMIWTDLESKPEFL